MATRWRDISTAPTDGSRIRVKRQLGNRVIYDGPAEWRRFTAPPLINPFTGEQLSPASDEMAWMRPADSSEAAFKVPTPTHWMP